MDSIVALVMRNNRIFAHLFKEESADTNLKCYLRGFEMINMLRD
jgi:hypothetical protein